MGTRRTARAAPPADVEVDDDDQDATDVELALAFDDLPANVQVKAYRVLENGTHAWCWTGPPAEATEERLAQFGPGKYRLMARQKLPNGRERLQRSRDVHIHAAPPAPVQQPAAGGSSDIVEKIANAALLSLLKSMSDSQEAAARQNREHSAAMALLLEKIAKPDPLLGTLLEKSLGGRVVDPLDQALRINELTNKTRSSSGVAELIGTLDALDRIKARVRGKGEDGDDEGGGWAGVFKELIPRMLPAPNDNNAPATGGDSDRATVPAPIAAAGRAPAPALTLERSPVARIPAHLAPLAPFFPQLLLAAERNVPVEQTADFLLALLPDAVLELAEPILAGDTLVTEITTAEPQLAPHGQYVDAVCRQMLEQLKSWEVEGEDESGGEGGDTAAA
jgi:hypothetical protein